VHSVVRVSGPLALFSSDEPLMLPAYCWPCSHGAGEACQLTMILTRPSCFRYPLFPGIVPAACFMRRALPLPCSSMKELDASTPANFSYQVGSVSASMADADKINCNILREFHLASLVTTMTMQVWPPTSGLRVTGKDLETCFASALRVTDSTRCPPRIHAGKR
jgi:hypothetical protein